MEGLLYLSLYSFLSALAFTAILCSLPGAWRSFPRTPNVSSNGNPGYESLPLTDRQSPPPSYSPSMLTGYGGGQSHPNPAHSRNLYSR
ncbi:protein tweety homolog 2-like isoform X2 [Notothenia coriiceps]|uniref:Protein tweety homolog 2-like isoform X2 n=2 Tax=Nototheniidae TaxID=8206 RepID=A0A6I9PIG2_9TELE|nr:PREDICTED: protein tweety homolog 2-like isoform X2 [Notothenia coriiceps]